MSYVIGSKLAGELYEEAGYLNEKENPPITAERFFVAALDHALTMAGKMDGLPWDTETWALRHRMMFYVPDIESAIETLMAHICHESYSDEEHMPYMNERLREAERLCMEHNAGELDTLFLITSIVMKPSDVIRSVLTPDWERATELPLDLKMRLERVLGKMLLPSSHDEKDQRVDK